MKRRYSVDAICITNKSSKLCEQKFVFIRRLSFPYGLALVGGGIEKGENKKDAIEREGEEETGLTLNILYWLPKIYDKPGRDERWPSTSYVAVCGVEGVPKNEEGKTEVLFLTLEEALLKEKEFVFDHYEIFLDYVALAK